MPQQYENAKLKLAIALYNVKHAALTANLWSNQNMDSFIFFYFFFIGEGANEHAAHLMSSVGWRALKAEQKERNPNTTPLKLIQEVSTRWNSKFYMVSRVLQLSDVLALVCRKLIQAPDYLSACEEKVGKEIIKILEIFEQATKLVSADTYPTSSLIIPVICGLYENLTTLGTDIGKMFCSSVRRNMSSRLLVYETRTVTQMLTFLHPVLRSGFRRSENMLSAKEISPSMLKLKLQKRLKVLALFGAHLVPLNVLALKYLSVPATSVPSERIFSKSGYILSSRRSRLQADAVDHIYFLNQNYDLCD
ncbi:unnamed protein product [Parnassius mnemosyne]|uniref:HAT C-terminal dimerisation domain-containing protein n=1 Tax=Parnassius mnemosyne TaxID=213953 RepID=A0AAV1LE59_9NEOP